MFKVLDVFLLLVGIGAHFGSGSDWIAETGYPKESKFFRMCDICKKENEDAFRSVFGDMPCPSIVMERVFVYVAPITTFVSLISFLVSVRKDTRLFVSG